MTNEQFRDRRFPHRLHPDDLDALSEAVILKMKSEFTIPSEQHYLSHQYIESMIERDKARTEFYAEMRKTAMQWSIAAILGYLAYKVFGVRVRG